MQPDGDGLTLCSKPGDNALTDAFQETCHWSCFLFVLLEFLFHQQGGRHLLVEFCYMFPGKSAGLRSAAVQDVIFYGVEVSVQKEQNSSLKLCRVLILLLAAGGLLFNDPQCGDVGVCIPPNSALEFPLLYFYIFHSSCLASGLLGFLLTLYTMKLKSSISSGQYLAWNFLAKVITAGLSPFLFEIAVNVPTACCLLLAGFAEVLLLYIERTGT
ncbi:hypothetical protein E2320_011333 [Naja naja]|nr:hypothetical protein E2320_011333 [Naja naja]